MHYNSSHQCKCLNISRSVALLTRHYYIKSFNTVVYPVVVFCFVHHFHAVGHRGVSVEIHPDLLSFDDMLLSRPSSLVKVKFVHESLMFCNGQIPSVSNTSSQRLSLRADGYFIPPKTSLYTFNILSVTGESQLYLVHNSSGPVLVASSRSGSLHG